jgi:transposase
MCKVAQISGIEKDLGKKGEYGILALMPRRAAFLSDPTHKLVFHYTPNHSSWMNQIEIWLSILVRKLLTRGSFTSVAALETRVLAFIDYYNRTMAKPFKWTHQGKALTV